MKATGKIDPVILSVMRGGISGNAEGFRSQNQSVRRPPREARGRMASGAPAPPAAVNIQDALTRFCCPGPPSIAFQVVLGIPQGLRHSREGTFGQWGVVPRLDSSPSVVSRPGGSYKKIGYYDSTKDDLSWSKTDKWIGKQVLRVFPPVRLHNEGEACL